VNKLRVIVSGLVLALGLFVAQGAGAMGAGVNTSVSSVALAAQPSVRVVDGQVEISVPGDDNVQVVIYALTGQVVKTLTVSPGVTAIELPAGYYIIKCGKLSQRVIVR